MMFEQPDMALSPIGMVIAPSPYRKTRILTLISPSYSLPRQDTYLPVDQGSSSRQRQIFVLVLVVKLLEYPRDLLYAFTGSSSTA